MRDLEFEPAVTILAGKLGTAEGEGPALCLSQLGACAVPTMLAGLQSSNPIERRNAAYAVGDYNSRMGPMDAARLAAVLPGLLRDADARIRRAACYAAEKNWEPTLAPRLAEMLGDENVEVRRAARSCLSMHRDDSQISVYKKIVEEDGLAASEAIILLWGDDFSREQLVHFFSSTNLPVVSTAFTRLRRQDLTLKEIEPLLTNSLAMARMMGLGALAQIGDKEAVTRIVAMLRDSNEAVRWSVRSRLRQLTGQKLGSDPAAYEKWWAKNKNDFTPHPPFGPGAGNP
jgi:HEAT repeat protein